MNTKSYVTVHCHDTSPVDGISPGGAKLERGERSGSVVDRPGVIIVSNCNYL